MSPPKKVSELSSVPVITIDGPSASGKGTISQIVADRFAWHFLDSGSLYRLCGLAAYKQGVDLDDEAALVSMIATLNIEFALPEALGQATKICLDGQFVEQQLRNERMATAASRVAALAGVRQALLTLQRNFRQLPGLVADGRDMGTTVFPDATLKIFLLASSEERARRRYKQLKEKGMDVNLSAILNELEARDRRDRERVAAPLRAAEDAEIIDTTAMGIDSVVEKVLACWESGR